MYRSTRTAVLLVLFVGVLGAAPAPPRLAPLRHGHSMPCPLRRDAELSRSQRV